MAETPSNVPIEAVGKRFKVFRERHNFGRGEVKLVRVTPELIKIDPITDRSTLPLLFIHGGRDQNLDRYLELFAEEGREAFGVAYTGKRANLNSGPVRKPGISIDLPDLQVTKAEDILDAMKLMGINQADTVSLSEGSLRGMIAVALKPELFRNVVLVHPAGMDDRGYKSTHARVLYSLLLQRMSKVRNTEVSSKKSGGSLLKEGLTYLKLDPKRVRAEQNTIAHARLHPLLPHLRLHAPHLLFSIVADAEDVIYPPNRLKQVNGAYLSEFVTSKWGGHGMGHKVDRVREIDNLLTKMQQTRATKKP